MIKKAIIIVYNDGFIDTIELKDGNYCHADYYKMICEYSDRLKLYYVENVENIFNHNITDHNLMLDKCAIVFNWLLKSTKDTIFNWLLPNEYGSVEQIKIVRKLITNFIENRTLTNIYNPTIERCKSCDIEYALDEIDRQEEMLKNSKNR